MEFTRVKINTTVPTESAEAIRNVLGEAGAGSIGEYSFCSFSISGKGRFMPSKYANSHIGHADMLEIVEEELIEVKCGWTDAKRVISALRKAHPYQEPILDIIPLIDEDQL